MSTSSDWRRRFWAKVEWRFSGCWEWTAARQPNGYGVFDRVPGGGTRYVHRIAWELLFGPIAEGLVIDHLCRNRACVNPAHLEPVTMGQNLRRGWRVMAARCKHGHPRTPENTYIYRGRRSCLICRRETARERARGIR